MELKIPPLPFSKAFISKKCFNFDFTSDIGQCPFTLYGFFSFVYLLLCFALTRIRKKAKNKNTKRKSQARIRRAES